MNERFFAVCPKGLEGILAEELRTLDCAGVEAGAGGAHFRGSLATARAANLHSRLASRILWLVAHGPYRSENELYEAAAATPWEEFFSPELRLRVDVSATRSPLRSLQFATLRVKDGIVDRARDRTGTRPSVDRTRPEVQVMVHLQESTAWLYLDLSGESLFKRGWRAEKGEAPIKENLAAALLHLSGWSPGEPLLDPFCGSGTIAIEAACRASRRAPGLQRHFAFERLLGFDRSAWQAQREAAQAAIDDAVPVSIVGRDISSRVVALAQANARRAGLAALLERRALRFEVADARQGEPTAARGVVVSNPPYGEQSNPRSAPVAAMMGDIAGQLKRRFPDWTVWLLSSDRQLPQQMRLRESAKTVVFNGALECRFFRFNMVSGSLRRTAAGGAPPPQSGTSDTGSSGD